MIASIKLAQILHENRFLAEMCREWELMGIPIPIPTIPGNFGNGNENLSWGIIPTIPGNMGMGMNFRGKSQIPMGIPKNEFLSVKSLKSFESKRKIWKT